MFDYGDHCATSLAVQSCARLIGAPPRLSIGAVARQFGRCGLAPGRCACAPYASLNDGREHYDACMRMGGGAGLSTSANAYDNAW